MSNLANFQQTTLERKRYTIGYKRWMDTDETLFDHTFVVTPNTDVPLIVEDGFTSNADTEISFFVSGGESGVVYTLKMVASTTDGQVKEDDLQMVIF